MRSCGGLESGAMAIFHLQINTVSRSAGRSATAAAAYRSAERITDERTGEIHDYTRKGGVEASALFAPADAPAWAADRAQLWNAAEGAETRKNSTVAREFVVALPAELSAEDRQALAFDLGRAMVARHGVAVDVCIHAPGKEGDERNHHAHILMTTRRMTREGLTEKTRELDNQRSGEVDHWRQEWARLANAALERAGRSERIDHRTLEEQGIERQPTVHNGPAITEIQRSGRTSTVAERRQADAVAFVDQVKAEAQALAVDLAKAQDAFDQAQQEVAKLREQLATTRTKSHREMNAKELMEEVNRRRKDLPSTEQLAAQDPQVQETRQRFQQVQEQQKVAISTEQKAWRAEQAWRKANPVRTWLHDRGLMTSGRLQELSETWSAAVDRVKVLEQVEAQAHRDSRDAWHRAEVLANVELSPERTKIEKLHRLALERQRDERQQQRSQGKSAGLVEREFKALAAKRAVRANGYSDHSQDWKETPKELRDIVDAFNREPKELQAKALRELMADDTSRKGLQALMERREQALERSHQFSR